MHERCVRPVNYDDLTPLSAALGDGAYFVERFERQKDSKGMLFGAWLGERPVGDVYLWWEEAEEDGLRSHLPGVPLLTHLEVLPECRNRGIGRLLIAAVEEYTRDELSKPRTALAVRTDNHAARRLYQRVGYQDWGYGEVVCFKDPTGSEGHREPEFCHVLVRELSLASAQPQAAFGEPEIGQGSVHIGCSDSVAVG